MADESTEADEDRPADDEREVAVDQPGLALLRNALVAARRRVPSRKTLSQEGTAGLTVAVGSVPDGMANALLVGVNPVYGLYANIAAPVAGGLLASSQLMVINSTSAGAIVAGQSLEGLTGADREGALFLLCIVAGIFQVLAGVFRLSRLTRYISFSVMTGFVTGIAIVLGLSQVPTVTGVAAEGDSAFARAFDVVTRPGDIHLATLGFGVAAGALMWAQARTRLSKVGALVAVALPSALVALLGFDGVGLVEDMGDLPTGLPSPYLPGLSDLSWEVVTGAFSLAVVILVQGTGVSQSVSSAVENKREALTRDFVAQGAANVASGVMRGLPAGGSFKGTALNATAGGRRRWAAVFSGIWMLVIVLAFADFVAVVAMPALGGLLIFVSISSIKPGNIATVWHAGGNARLAGGFTFVSTLLLPIQVAVLIGVVLAGILYIQESATDLSVVELVRHDDGTIEERRRPRTLRSNDVTVLDVYGHLFYAGADRLDRILPVATGTERPVVVIRLRGRTSLGASVVDVLSLYAEQVRDAGGRTYVSGLSRQAKAHLLRTGHFTRSDAVHHFEASSILGESTGLAVEHARAWLLTEPSSGDQPSSST